MADEPRFDQNLILTFLFQVQRFEEILRQAGFRKPNEPTEVDWGAFLSKVEEKFDPKASAELQGAIACCLDWDIKHPRRKKYHPPLIYLLADQIQEQRRTLTQGINFHSPTEDEYDMMIAALVILAEWFDLIALE
jgi:hypothetical protein